MEIHECSSNSEKKKVRNEGVYLLEDCDFTRRIRLLPKKDDESGEEDSSDEDNSNEESFSDEYNNESDGNEEIGNNHEEMEVR